MLKKVYFILSTILIFVACSKNKSEQILSDKAISDSLSYFIKEINSDFINENKKKQLSNKVSSFVQNLKNSPSHRDSIFNISLNFYQLKDWINFNKTSDVLINYSKQSNDSINLVKSYRYKANYLKKISSYDSSYYYYLKAEKIYKKIGDKEGESIILLNKGIVQYAVDDFLGAELSLSKSYYYFKKVNDYEKIYGVQNQLGLVYNELKDYDSAKKNLNEAIEVVRKNNLNYKNEHQETICLINLGLVSLKEKDYKKAIEYYSSAIKDETLRDDFPDFYATVLDNLAYSKLQIDDSKGVLKLFLESIKIRDSLKSSFSVISNTHIAEYYHKKNNDSLKEFYLNKALKLADKFNSPYDKLYVLQQASTISPENSTKFSNDYIRINDSLQLVERNSKDRFARIELETDELKRENFILEERNRDVLNYLFGTILFSAFVYYMRVQRSKERELALKQAHQQANEEIYRLIISHQNQLEEGRDLEKKRLSKELHDGVLGRLFGLRLNLDGLNNYDDNDAKQQRLDYLNELKIIEQDLREISHELSRENLVLINNFVAILNRLVEEQAKVNSAKIKMIISDHIEWDKVSNMLKINMYRILQEALQNINKHAKAKNIRVNLLKDKKGNLLFEVEDDGIGFDLTDKKKKGIGTKNIISRAQQCKGIIDIKSEIGVGSKIIITFPLDNEIIKI